MKKAIFIFMMTLAVIGTVSAAELKLECTNESQGITKCSLKANLEGSKKIELDYNFDSGIKLGQYTESNESQGWKIVRPTTLGTTGKLTFENTNQVTGETELGTIELEVTEAGSKNISFSINNLDGVSSSVTVSKQLNISEQTKKLLYLEIDDKKIDIENIQNIVTTKDEIKVKVLVKNGSSITGLGQETNGYYNIVLNKGENNIKIVVDDEEYEVKVTRELTEEEKQELIKQQNEEVKVENPETGDKLKLYSLGLLGVLTSIIIVKKKLSKVGI